MDYKKLYQTFLSKEKVVNADNILSHLRINDIIDQDEECIVRNRVLISHKNTTLFLDIMPAKGETGFQALTEWCKNSNNFAIAENLSLAADTCQLEKIETNFKFNQVTNDELALTQRDLRQYYRENCEIIAKYWKRSLKVSYMEDAFVEVQNEFLSAGANPTGIYLKNYEELFESKARAYKRIVVEGDPGYGKTTYVNKLVLDWAHENEYLSNRFSLLFLLPLHQLQSSIRESIGSFVPPELTSWMECYLKNPRNKVLFILDAFDELPKNHVCYEEVLRILKKDYLPCVTVLLTSRRSHTNLIPEPAFDQWLMITGFDAASIDCYLKKQGVAKTAALSFSRNLKSLLRIPIFAAMSCLFYNRQEKLTEADNIDSYDIIENYVDSVINYERQTKSTSEEIIKSYMMKICKFACLKFDDDFVLRSFGDDLVRMWSEVVEESRQQNYLDDVTFGLLIKSQIPTGTYGQFVCEFSFIHQLVAECCVARFLLSTNEWINLQMDRKFIDCLYVEQRQSPVLIFFVKGLVKKWPNIKLTSEESRRLLTNPILCTFLLSQTNDDNDNVHFDQFKILHINHGISHALDTLNHEKFTNLLDKFFDNVGRCKNLHEISFAKCNISWEPIETFAEVLRKNQFNNLENIDFSENGWGEFASFFNAVKSNSAIKRLNFSDVKLSKQSVESFAIALEGNAFPYLEELSLNKSRCEIGNSVKFFNALRRCVYIRYLDFNECYLTENCVQLLAISLKEENFSQLEALYVSYSPNVGKSADFFGGLKHCPNMRRLDIGNCKVLEKCLTLFAESIQQRCFSLLEILCVSSNSAIGHSAGFFEALKQLTNLRELDLSWCCVDCADSVCACFKDGYLHELETLNLRSSNVGKFPSVFNSLAELPHLRDLNLHSCNLTEDSFCALTTLCRTGKFAMVEKLDLSSNHVVGKKMDLLLSFNKCRRLKYFAIEDCGINTHRKKLQLHSNLSSITEVLF